MILFGTNFAIGIATGLILEFEFGTNWSNYSWFVGDIFGAPLAIEGIFAFFLESTFIAGLFGLVSSLFLAFTGDTSARTISVVQPVKFAAFEALYRGKTNAGLVAFGILKKSEIKIGEKNINDFAFKIEFPDLLSVMTKGVREAYVPGLYDHINGNNEQGLLSVNEKIERGEISRQVLMDYKAAKKNSDIELTAELKAKFETQDFKDNYFKYFGYAFLNAPEDIIPNVPIAFYSFHIMVMPGFFFILLFIISLYFLYNNNMEKKKWFLWVALLSIPLPYIASELGWVLTEIDSHG